METTHGGEPGGLRHPLVHVGPADTADTAHEHGAARPPVRRGTERAARNWALACHLSPLLAWAVGVPGLVAPLLVWLVKRHDLPAIDVHGREAFNFQLTILLAELGLAAFTLLTFGLGAIVAVPLAVVIAVGAVVLMIVAAVRAAEGRVYRYPLTWRPL